MKLMIDIDEENEETLEYIKRDIENAILRHTIAFEIKPQKTGHWVYRHYNWWCSECGEQPKTLGYVGTAKFMYDEFKFCNHCGVKMIGGIIYE